MIPETIQDLPYELLDTGLRLFTETPYPEFDYIVTPREYEFCANQSLFAYLRKECYWIKWVEVSADQVLGYITEQIAILRYNNPDIEKKEIFYTLVKVLRWGSENALDKIAYDTIITTLNDIMSIDNYEDIINFTHKSVWYSDIIMKPVRFQGETWKEYTERLRVGKVHARSKFKNMEAKSIVEEESYTLQSNSGGIIPTAQILNKLTEIPVRKIREVTLEDIVWQSKSNMNVQIIRHLKRKNENITQAEIAEVLGVTDRQVRKILNNL